jgi:hypothetical protein
VFAICLVLRLALISFNIHNRSAKADTTIHSLMFGGEEIEAQSDK